MHPSKVHQSTTKQPDSGLRFGFGGFDVRNTAPLTHSGIQATAQNTPTKTKGGLPIYMSSPTFDFSFHRPEADLSEETNKIMESVREEAARIKAALLEERNKQDQKDSETSQLFGFGGRKLVKSKGKSGRYSDVHKQEFKKMDSIANHASVWKNKLQANTTSLKRSPSKAGLDAPQAILSRTKSFKSIRAEELGSRLENASPGKRIKQSHDDDASTARPVSRDTHSEMEGIMSSPTTARPHPDLPSAITTPTKSSLARAASVKAFQTSMIPSLSRSASTKTLASPVAPKTEGSHKYLSSLSKFGGMKSILHRHQPKFSDDPLKVAAGTHLPVPQQKKDVNKDLPSLPGTPSQSLVRSPSMKRIGLTPSVNSKYGLGSSPSPSKTPSLPPQLQMNPEPREPSKPISYPSLANSPNITTRTKISKSPAPTSTPGDFTFTSGKPINFGLATSGLKSPTPSTTIRQVRPSGFPTPLPSAVFDEMPAIAHGIGNKKRHRVDSDEEIENKEPNTTLSDTEDVGRSPTKKQKITAGSGEKGNGKVSGNVGGKMTGSRLSKAGPAAGGKERRGALSLSRLNMLARPKERK